MLSGTDGKLHDVSFTLPRLNDFSHSASVGDIDGDGDLDIFVGVTYNSTPGVGGKPYFLMNDGRGSFTANQSRVPNSLTNINTSDPSANANRVQSSVMVDVNRDGFADLLVGASTDGTVAAVRTFLNDGHGNFSDARRIDTVGGIFGANNTLVQDIKPMDLNNDGIMDLILTENPRGYGDGQAIQLLIGNGDGSFRDETSARMLGVDNRGYWGTFLNVADVDSNGTPDIVVYAGTHNGTVSQNIWLNNGNGVFSAGAIPDTNFRVGDLDDLLPVDFNRDGRMDFVSITGNSVNGTNTFQTYTNTTPLNQTNVIHGTNEAETLRGNTGNNMIVPFAGNDVIDGGDGIDTVYLNSLQRDTTIFSEDDGTFTAFSSTGIKRLIRVENVMFGADTTSTPITSLAKDPELYLASNHDLIGAFGHNTAAAEQHYVQYGQYEGRSFSAFNPVEYLAGYSDLIQVFGANTEAATDHFLDAGFREGRSMDAFDNAAYLRANPDVAAWANGNEGLAAVHYVTSGFNEHRLLSISTLGLV
ncbi:hypothetical protein TSH7_07620 [Azospirillum sp. TSH7]|nr:hypothetical protein TSH7_07620 [Azospirillum sp. TSH7]